MKMKNYKAVLKSSLVMLVLFAVAGSGVAQAQECLARAKTSQYGSRRGHYRGCGGHRVEVQIGPELAGL